jgi:hypothetical protein
VKLQHYVLYTVPVALFLTLASRLPCTAERSILFRREFSPQEVQLIAVVARTLRPAKDLLAEAKSRFGDDLLFAVNGGFFDPATGKSVGMIVADGRVITAGVATIGVFVAQKRGYLVIGEPLPVGASFAMGGNILLVQNGKAAFGAGMQRRISPRAALARMCLGIRQDGSGLILCAEGSLRAVARVLIRAGCRDAAAIDCGSSCFFYAGGHVSKSTDRRIKCLIVGLRRPRNAHHAVLRAARESSSH